MVFQMPTNWTKRHRISALFNGVLIGVGALFLLWGSTDIIFPVTNWTTVAVFGLTRIILGIVSISVGVGAEATQWARMWKERGPEDSAFLDHS